MQGEKGLTTLSIIVGILSLVMLLALSISVSSWAYIKKSQNIGLSMHQSRLSEAGIDCALAVINEEKLNSIDLNVGIDDLTTGINFCKEATGVDSIELVKEQHNSNEENKRWWLRAKKQYKQIQIMLTEQKILPMPFKTAGSVCVLDGNTCDESNPESINLSDDIQYTPHSFNDFFGQDKSKWKEIKSQFTDVIMTSSGDEALCGTKLVEAWNEQISRQLKAGLITLWVDGDCYLDDVSALFDNDDFPAFIVIKDGVLSAASHIKKLNASIFQFNYDRKTYLDSWVNADFQCKNNVFKTICEARKPTITTALKDVAASFHGLAFLFEHEFELKGGYIQEVAGGLSFIQNGFDLNVSGEWPLHLKMIEERFNQPLIWIKGSKHDF